MSSSPIIKSYGIGTQHYPNDTFNRTLPDDIYLMMAFRTPILISTAYGIVRGSPGDCILHSPNFSAYHTSFPSSSASWANDWVYFYASRTKDLIQEINLPLNVLIHTKNPLILQEPLEKIQQEMFYQKPYFEQRIELTLRDILYMLARAEIETSSDRLNTMIYNEKLIDLRQSMSESLSSDWTIEKMSSFIGLSKNRFFAIYKSQFRETPLNDLLNMRIQHALYLLRASTLNIAEIATACGFKNEYYFSGFFKKKIGVSPTVYRKSDTPIL